MMKKFRFYKMMVREILETLCTICLYIEREGRFSRNLQAQNMRLHFDSLKWYSDSIADELEKAGRTRCLRNNTKCKSRRRKWIK